MKPASDSDTYRDVPEMIMGVDPWFAGPDADDDDFEPSTEDLLRAFGS